MGNQSGVELTNHIVKCTHCYNIGRMRIVGTHSDIRNYGEDVNLSGFQTFATYDAGTFWEFLLCEACNNVLVQKSQVDDRFDDVATVETVYPESGQLIGYLPEKIATAYQNALRVRNTGDAYAVLLGKLLETVCIDQNAAGKDLYDGLRRLGAAGTLPAPLVEAADSIRSLRNIGAHASPGNIENDDIPILDSLTKAVLEYVYVGPALVSRAKERIARSRKS